MPCAGATTCAWVCVPTLLEPGTSYFTPVPRSLHERGFSVAEAVAEVGAQLERARDTGLTISYLDEHMGVGWISGDAGKLGDALRDLAAREGLLYVADFKLSGLPRVNVPFVGDGPADPAESLTRYWLTALEATSAGDYLLVTHPGRVAPDMELFALAGQPTGVIARERDAERRALSSPELRAGLERLGVTPRRYDEL
jgi:chitin disaccharide deacetylase